MLWVVAAVYYIGDTNIAAYKSAVREQKIALEISAAKREQDFYQSKVDKSHALNSIEERLKEVNNVYTSIIWVACLMNQFQIVCCFITTCYYYYFALDTIVCHRVYYWHAKF